MPAALKMASSSGPAVAVSATIGVEQAGSGRERIIWVVSCPPMPGMNISMRHKVKRSGSCTAWIASRTAAGEFHKMAFPTQQGRCYNLIGNDVISQQDARPWWGRRPAHYSALIRDQSMLAVGWQIWFAALQTR